MYKVKCTFWTLCPQVWEKAFTDIAWMYYLALAFTNVKYFDTCQKKNTHKIPKSRTCMENSSPFLLISTRSLHCKLLMWLKISWQPYWVGLIIFLISPGSSTFSSLVADPGLPVTNQRRVTPTYYLAKFSWKPHANEENWAERKGQGWKFCLCRSTTVLHILLLTYFISSVINILNILPLKLLRSFVRSLCSLINAEASFLEASVRARSGSLFSMSN